MRYGFVQYVTEIVLEIQKQNVPRHVLAGYPTFSK